MVTQVEAQTVIDKYQTYYRNQNEYVGMGFDGTSILIYVTQLTPQLNSFLPKNLDGIPVRIIVTGGKVVPVG